MTRPRALGLLLLAVLGMRLALLLKSQHFVCGDEASVGVMAKHVLEGTEHPGFAWRSRYNGGAALTAYFAAAGFAALGMSETVLKLVPMGLSVFAVVVVFRLAAASGSFSAALTATVCYASSVVLMKWNFDARGGYMESQVLMPLSFLILDQYCLRPAPRLLHDALLGLLCGFGVYVFPLFLPTAVVCVLFVASRGRASSALPGAAAWLVGACVGAAPILLLGGDLAPLDAANNRLLNDLWNVPVTLGKTLSRTLPALFRYDNLDGLPPIRGIPNLVEYAVAWVAVLAWLLHRRRTPVPGSRLGGVLSLYLFVFIVLFSLHPLAGEEARPLVFLEPALSILTGLGLASLMGTHRSLAMTLAAALLLSRSSEYVRLLGDERILGPLGPSDPRVAPQIASLLEAQGIDRVVTDDWDLGWRIAFLTRERISVTHSFGTLGKLLRDDDERPRTAVIVNAASADADRVSRLLERRGLVSSRAFDLEVFALRDLP